MRNTSKFLPVYISFLANERGPEMIPNGQILVVQKYCALYYASVYLLSLCVILLPNLKKTQGKQERRSLSGGWLSATDAAKGKNSVEEKFTGPPTNMVSTVKGKLFVEKTG